MKKEGILSSPSDERSLLVPWGTPLIGIPVEVNGQWMVRSFVGDPREDDPVEDERSLEAALSVIGAWSDLDWESYADDLDRIRHESRPTPPIEL